LIYIFLISELLQTIKYIIYYLTYQILRGCRLLTDEGVSSIGTYCSFLNSFDVGENPNITNAGLYPLLGSKNKKADFLELSLEGCDGVNDSSYIV